MYAWAVQCRAVCDIGASIESTVGVRQRRVEVWHSVSVAVLLNKYTAVAPHRDLTYLLVAGTSVFSKGGGRVSRRRVPRLYHGRRSADVQGGGVQAGSFGAWRRPAPCAPQQPCYCADRGGACVLIEGLRRVGVEDFDAFFFQGAEKVARRMGGATAVFS